MAARLGHAVSVGVGLGPNPPARGTHGMLPSRGDPLKETGYRAILQRTSVRALALVLPRSPADAEGRSHVSA